MIKNLKIVVKNLKKQEIVEKISNYYINHNVNDSDSIILYTNKDLDSYIIKIIKENVRKIGHIISVKNTLFKIFLKKNDIHMSEDFSGHNYAFFCQDVFEGVNLMKTIIKDLKIEQRFILQCVFVNKCFIPKNTISSLSNCQNKNQLYAYTYSMLSSFVLPVVNTMHLISQQQSSDK